MWDVIRRDWGRWRPAMAKQWERLTAEQLEAISGDRARLVDRIRDGYGVDDAEAERQVRSWETALDLPERVPRVTGAGDRRQSLPDETA